MTTLLRTFRLVCDKEDVPVVESLLKEQGFDFEPEPFFGLARKLTKEPFPLGESIAARFGCIYIQDRSSMLPPLLLAPPVGASVLDMCSAPGVKQVFFPVWSGETDSCLPRNHPLTGWGRSGRTCDALRRSIRPRQRRWRRTCRSQTVHGTIFN